MNRVLIDVENECRKSGGGRKGAQKRKSYDFSYKMDVINELDAGICAEDVAFKMNINKSFVSKWKDARKTIIDNAASSHLKLLKKGRKSKKHNALFERLIVKFRAARKNEIWCCLTGFIRMLINSKTKCTLAHLACHPVLLHLSYESIK